MRLGDNRAFYHAVKDSDFVLAVAFLTPAQWQRHHDSPAKIAFYQANLRILGAKLSELGIELKVIEVPDYAHVAGHLARLAVQNNCEKVYYNCEYEVNEQKRDEDCDKALRAAKIKTKTFHDRLIIEPGRVLTASGGYYTVFTPFRRSWLGVAPLHDLKPLPVPDQKFPALINSQSQTLPDTGNEGWRADLWPAGEIAAAKRLQQFVAGAMEKYHLQRDLPFVDGTSLLSPWLAIGVLSPRQCLDALLLVDNQAMKHLDSGAGTWLNELIWRDFYGHVLYGFPRVSRSLPFKEKTSALRWNSDDKLLLAWKMGLTGYPIVDAAMRQLAQTGWMHNRLRMVTAMFLSKHLFIDWRQGEKYFMETLLDGDLAANNGGWQWSASTGTDAVPYFRIFNPFSQSRRFDADGHFIKKYCPELADLPAAVLHDPKKLKTAIDSQKLAYPQPVVDHQMARARVLAAFKAIS